jgi:hypothetical protein
VLIPGLVVIARSVAEGRKHTFQIVRILEPDVFLDQRDAGRVKPG